MRRTIRLVFAALGLILFAWLVWRVGVWRLLESMSRLGWGVLVIFILGGISHSFKVMAWRFTFAPEQRTMSLGRMFAVRLAGEAVGQLTFAGQVMGETTRALMIRRAVGVVKGVSSVVLDRSVFIFSGLLIAVAGIVLSVLILPLPGSARLYNTLIALSVAAFVCGGIAVVRYRVPLLSRGFRVLGRFPKLAPLVEAKSAGVSEIESSIFRFYHDARKDFWACFGLNLLGHAAAVTEVYVILWYLGVPITVTSAFIIEALTKVVNIGGFLIPGNLGASEGGAMLILRILELGGPNGLTLALARRLRGLMWAAVGLTVIGWEAARE